MRALLLVGLAACGPSGPGTDTGPLTLPTATSTTPIEIRVVTWNVESVGTTGSPQYEALRDVLARIDADVVGLNEIDAFENDEVEALAAELGYDQVLVAQSNPFGDLRNAMLARVPVQGTVHRSADLSGDPSANDVTRYPLSMTLDNGVSIVTMHCKSGFDDSDELRRTVDAIRMAQSGADPARTVLMGDINQEVGEGDIPARFTDFPYGMPGTYYLGQDLYDVMVTDGLENGPFPHFEAAGFTVVEAAQVDGTLATRPSSGRRIDYVLTGSGLAGAVLGAEIYDARDDGEGAGLPKAGAPPARTSSEIAADHLPVFVDLRL